MEKFRTLYADEIDVRVSRITSNGVALLLYKDARCDMNILDETVGSLNWKRQHTRDNANCVVSIWDSDKSEWVSKEDTGTESNTEAEKGLASDSFKRACVNWGIGRELYTAPSIFTNVAQINNGKCYDKFAVTDIEYDAKRNISKLTIYNTTMKKQAFAYVGVDDSRAKEVIKCERCGENILPSKNKDGVLLMPYQVAEITKQKFGGCLCAKCVKELSK